MLISFGSIFGIYFFPLQIYSFQFYVNITISLFSYFSMNGNPIKHTRFANIKTYKYVRATKNDFTWPKALSDLKAS